MFKQTQECLYVQREGGGRGVILHVCFRTGVCMSVCVCSLLGPGRWPDGGDHFQSAGDLTLISSMLMTAAGLKARRAQRSCLNQYAFCYKWL